MNCPNDVGIYLNKSAETLLHNNTIANTRGIDVRFPETDVEIVNSIVDGRILARDGGNFSEVNNILSTLKAVFLGSVTTSTYADPERGDFRIKDLETIIEMGSPVKDGGLDLCNQPLGKGNPDIGPIQYRFDMDCVPVFLPN